MDDDVIFDDQKHSVSVGKKIGNIDFRNQRTRISKISYVAHFYIKMPVEVFFCLLGTWLKIIPSLLSFFCVKIDVTLKPFTLMETENSMDFS